MNRNMDQGLVDALEEATAERVHVFDVPPFPVPGVGRCRLCLGEGGTPRVWTDLDGVINVVYLCEACEAVAAKAREFLGKSMPLTAWGVVQRGPETTP